MSRPGLRLLRDRRGAALIEFALALPVVFALGGYGVELSNMAITGMRLSQIALAAADNMSRIGVGKDNVSPYQVQEGDVNDVLLGAQKMGAGVKLATYGRVTVSSLENVARSFSDGTKDSQPVMRLHWQRCLGAMTGYGTPAAPSYDSSYGKATPLDKAGAGTDLKPANSGPTVTNGFGANPAVTAPAGIGVVFEEINYQYQPLFGTMFASRQVMHYVGSFIVRDNRDYSRLFNNATTKGTPTPSTCDVPRAAVPTL